METVNPTVPDLGKEASVPLPAIWLGASGTIPFILGAYFAMFGSVEWATLGAQALAAYGAIILSFLGGIHWGLAVGKAPDARTFVPHLTFSVVPSLVGWAALLLPTGSSYLLLAGAFAAMFVLDLRLSRSGLAPAWYPRLRLPLTLVVIASLLAGGLGLS